MSKRTDKKKQKRINEVHTTAAHAAVLAEKILDKCKAEGMDSSDLKIYVKPEDKKAYYACAGGTGAIELA